MTNADPHELAPRPASPGAPRRVRVARVEIGSIHDRGIAHDLNNLLGIIINHAKFVADSLPEKGQAREDVEEIRDAARHAANLTLRLLTVGGNEVVSPEPLDLNEVVDSLGNLLRRALGERVVLETRFGDQLWPVEADRGELERMLLNLVVNARDAMPDGGRLILETTNAVVDRSSASGRCVRLTVRDFGVGMAPEVRRNAFEPFFTTKRGGHAAGLGLAVVDEIVTAASGWIDLRSERGIGTTIVVHLPALGADTPISR